MIPHILFFSQNNPTFDNFIHISKSRVSYGQQLTYFSKTELGQLWPIVACILLMMHTLELQRHITTLTHN